MPWLMKIHGTAGETFDPPQYLERADLDFAEGVGTAWLTLSPAKAQRFPSLAAVFELWRTSSSLRPFRADGLPNRPLTTYTIEPFKVED